MSAGPALLFESPAVYHGTYGLGARMDSTMQGGSDGRSGSSNGNSAFSDEDLIASLAGFAVEGQTERDLATIKSMLLQQHSFGHPSQQQQFTHNSYSSSNGAASHWPMASPAATTAWTSFQWNPASGQPPPNTPTLSKSMELYSSSAQQQQYAQQAANEYFGGGYYSNRRRDVSLERPAFLSNSSRTSSRHARSSSITSSVNADGSSLSTGFDMDMEEEITPTNEAGPSVIPAISSSSGYQRPQYTPAFPQNNEGNQTGNNGMEDIQEDSMRESMEDTSSTTRRQQHPSTNASSSNPSSSISILDNRTAGRSSGIAEESPPPQSAGTITHQQHKQWRSNTSTPVSSNRQSHSRPHSAIGFTSPSSPPQTRSRSRQQQQAAAAAALRFTSP